MLYDYSALCSDVRHLASQYRFLDFFSIGESVMEKKLCCLKIGTGKKKIFLLAAESGMEYRGSELLMHFLRQYCHAFSSGIPFWGISSAELFSSLSLYALPMANPDGVDIALHGLDITNPHHLKLISLAGIHSFSRVWQANARGVDLNRNFCPDSVVQKDSPGPDGFGGPFSESEPETKSIAEFLRLEKFDSLIHIHNRSKNPYYDYDRPPLQSGISTWFEKEFSQKSIRVELEPDSGVLTESELDIFLRLLAKKIIDEI